MDVKRAAIGAVAAFSITACASTEPRAPSHASRPSAQQAADQDKGAPGEDEALNLKAHHELALVQPLGLNRYLSIFRKVQAELPDRPDDAWERLRAAFELERVDNERIERERRLFAGRARYFQNVAERAEPYLYYILEELEERELPGELIALAIVESGFQPFAYSHGRAAGIWQFIPGTARLFGLKMNYWYDGRRDLVAATDAALAYLERLATAFDNDWLLAMAAYNAGRGNVRAAMERAEAQGRAPDYWNLQLPPETMRYVPRILAIRDILNKPEAYGISLPKIPNEPRIQIVEADQQLDLARAAELADVAIDQLYRLNPGYNRWATAPGGPHRLVLPVEEAERFKKRLAQKDRDELIEWRRHQVERGETLTHLAQQYNVTVDLIREINNLQDSALRAGDHLYVPVSSQSEREYTLSAANRLRELQQRERPGRRHKHTVQAGETLWDIARQYNVSVQELAQWNGMAPGDTLRPRQELVVWTEGGAIPATSAGPGQRTQSITYRVKRGDSLARIAQRFNVDIQDIRRWNDLDKGGYLYPGDELHLQVDVTQQSVHY